MIYIIGNGMFGRIAHDLLAQNNIESMIVDNENQNAGTRASGNITKPSWISGLGKEGKQGIEDLEILYGIEKFSPLKGLGKTLDLFYVSRPKIVDGPSEKMEVKEVGDGWFKAEGNFGKGVFKGTILVAAGVWSQTLVQMPKIKNITGVSFLYNKPPHYTPQFNLWAPYKQSISYDFGEEVWFGDGTAIKNENWSWDRVIKSRERAEGHGLFSPKRINVGYRPYVEGYKNGYFAKVHDNTWVSTGGGKNGIVLAAIQARKFMESL